MGRKRDMNARELDTLHQSEAYQGRFNNDRRCIIYDKRRKCFIFKHGELSLPLIGVTTHMKNTYWSKYTSKRVQNQPEFDESPYRTEHEARVLVEASKKFATMRASTRVHSGLQGMRRGMRVDNEVGKCMYYYGKYKIKPWKFMDKTADLGLSTKVPAADKRAMLNHQRNMHSYGRTVLVALHGLKLMPFMAQVRVGSAALRLGTAIDIVCKRFGNTTLDSLTPEKTAERKKKARGRQGVVIVELKCGYKQCYTRYSKMMTDECKSLANMPLNQHQLQLMATCKLFEMTYGDSYFVEDAFIIRVDAIGIYMYRLQDNVRALWPAIKGRLLKNRKDAIQRQKDKAAAKVRAAKKREERRKAKLEKAKPSKAKKTKAKKTKKRKRATTRVKGEPVKKKKALAKTDEDVVMSSSE